MSTINRELNNQRREINLLIKDMLDIIYDTLTYLHLMEIALSFGNIPEFSPTPAFRSTESLNFNSFHSSDSMDIV
jgi:hypothetical protein